MRRYTHIYNNNNNNTNNNNTMQCHGKNPDHGSLGYPYFMGYISVVFQHRFFPTSGTFYMARAFSSMANICIDHHKAITHQGSVLKEKRVANSFEFWSIPIQPSAWTILAINRIENCLVGSLVTIAPPIRHGHDLETSSHFKGSFKMGCLT